MESTRQQKIARLIQKEISGIFQLHGKIIAGGALITVTKVYVTRDLSICKIYLSIFTTRDKNTLLEGIRHHSREIRRDLGEKVRNQVRVIPELMFFLDDSLDYIDHIDELLHEKPD